MKIDQRALETSLKTTSKAYIMAFTIFGVVVYLLVYLGAVFTAPKEIATWKILIGAIAGAIFVSVVIVAVLILGRHLLMKLVDENTDTTIQ